MVDTIASVFAGVALAAACGFRVFVPLLVLSIASTLGAIPLADDFSWLATMPALIALATATIMEIAAYYVPWLDHALDVVATPAAVLAGVITTAAVVADLSPALRWALAIVGGGGVAGAVQGGTVLLRLKSGVMTAGVGNPLVATGETASSTVTSVLAVVVPVLAFFLVLATIVILVLVARRAIAPPRPGEPPESA
ncbi:MAG TPA: DUF4126 domain-containing protein [Candidatus Krumholzibacteria bacterium]|nr:DUF4126 domain-containing protein [Candidatus Krumholzibacteria bacterium]